MVLGAAVGPERLWGPVLWAPQLSHWEHGETVCFWGLLPLGPCWVWVLTKPTAGLSWDFVAMSTVSMVNSLSSL